MSAHAVLADGASHDEVLAAVQQRVTTDFKIAHATVQVERKECAAHEVHLWKRREKLGTDEYHEH